MEQPPGRRLTQSFDRDMISYDVILLKRNVEMNIRIGDASSEAYLGRVVSTDKMTCTKNEPTWFTLTSMRMVQIGTFFH